MKKFGFSLLLVVFALSSVFAQEWKIASNYNVAFDSDDASGIFEELSGEITFDPNNLEKSKFVLVIKVGSIATGNFLKNSHAKGKDWFDGDNYPNIKFISNTNGFKKTADIGYEVTGHLQMHGVSKQITIPFTFSNNTLKAKFSVDRTDYGIGDPNNGVSKTIKINATIPLKKK